MEDTQKPPHLFPLTDGVLLDLATLPLDVFPKLGAALKAELARRLAAAKGARRE